MKFELFTVLLLSFEINGCPKVLDITSIKEKIVNPETKKILNEIDNLETIDHLRMENLTSLFNSLQAKIKELQSSHSQVPKSSLNGDGLQMLSKAECTKEIVGKRKVACGDLENIGSCKCKEGNEYTRNDGFKQDCKIDHCICLNTSKVHLFGLHRHLLNCIVI